MKPLLALIAILFLLAGCTSNGVDQGLGSAATSEPRPVGDLAGNNNQNTQTIEQSAEQTTGNANQAPQALSPDQPTAPPAQAAEQLASVEPQGPTQKISFLPVTGAPQSAVTLLAKSLRSEADERNIQLLPANQKSADYEIKGYFSALDDGAGTLVVYVWDVLDQNGRRVHRISGNERSPRNSSEPWSSITEKELNQVTDATMSKLASWLARQS